MGVAANYIARLINRHHWLIYVGVFLVAYVVIDMIWRGLTEVGVSVGGVVW
jgi:predicted tellurium resistance membrane protein TerC